MQKGILKRWDDAKGFGFIQPENGGAEVFLHVSSLQRLGRRPVIGDVVHFNMALDEKGRNRAASAIIEGTKSVFTIRPKGRRATGNGTKTGSNANRKPSRPAMPSDFFAKILTLAMIMAAIGFLSFAYDKLQSSGPVAEPEPEIEIEKLDQQFQCSGKSRCGQMTSCAEAMFYLANCPGTLTDGDGDGLPCEDQWCGH